MSPIPRSLASVCAACGFALVLAAFSGCQKATKDQQTSDDTKAADGSGTPHELTKASSAGNGVGSDLQIAQVNGGNRASGSDNGSGASDGSASDASASDASERGAGSPDAAQQTESSRRAAAAKQKVNPEAKKHYERGIAALRKQAINHKEVNDEFRKALEIQPDYIQAFDEYGAYLVNVGRIMDAAELFGEGAKIWDDADFHNDYGVVNMRTGAMADARRHFETALSKEPNHANANYNFGLALLNAFGLVDQAIDRFHLAIEAKPNYPEAHFGLGRAYAREGQLDKAAMHFIRASKMAKPKNYVGANFQLGKVFERQGKFREAANAYNEELRNTPHDAVVRYAIGLVSAQLGFDEQAVGHFLECVRNRPDHADAHYQLALILPRLNRIEEAISHNQDALNLRPDWPEALNSLAWLLATTPKSNLRNPKVAVELAEKARELADYKMPLVLDTLAAAYAEAGRFDEAITVAKQAAELANKSQQEKIAQEIMERVKLYEASQAFHEEPAGDAP